MSLGGSGVSIVSNRRGSGFLGHLKKPSEMLGLISEVGNPSPFT